MLRVDLMVRVETFDGVAFGASIVGNIVRVGDGEIGGIAFGIDVLGVVLCRGKGVLLGTLFGTSVVGSIV